MLQLFCFSIHSVWKSGDLGRQHRHQASLLFIVNNNNININSDTVKLRYNGLTYNITLVIAYTLLLGPATFPY